MERDWELSLRIILQVCLCMNKLLKQLKERIILTGIFVFVGLGFFSCSNDKAALKVDCIIPATVSFSQNIQPLFDTQCATPGCHTAAAHAGSLNLEAAASYSELLHHGSGYVDTLHPEFSILYNKLTTVSGFMPPTGKLDDCKIRTLLQWIQQKAKNN